MVKKQVSFSVLPFCARLAGAFCLALFVLSVLGGCNNPSTTPDPNILYPAPNLDDNGPSLTPGESYIHIQFTTVATAVGYRIYYSDDSNSYKFPPLELEQSSTQLVAGDILDLTNGVTYYVWAQSVYAETVSALRGPTSATPRWRPAVPAILTAEANNGHLELSWPMAEHADTYRVWYSESAQATEPPGDDYNGEDFLEFTGFADGMAHTVQGYIPGLTNNTPYTVWMRAWNPSGYSRDYVKTTGIPVETNDTPLTPAGKPVLKYASEQLTATWDAVKHATGYQLYYTTNESEAEVYNGTPFQPPAAADAGGRLSGTITGLTNNTSYYVWVTAVNGNLESGHSEYESDTPQPKPVLDMNRDGMVVGEIANRFPNEEAGHGDRLSRKKETALADLVADSMFYWGNKFKGTSVGGNMMPSNVHFAFFNGGTVKFGLNRGPISVGGIKYFLYDDQMSYVTMNGDKVKELFYNYVAKVRHDGGGGSGTGAFGQVSAHVRYVIDYSNNSRGGVISNLTFDDDPTDDAPGVPFDDNTSYTFVTNSWLLSENTDGYMTILKQGVEVKTGKLIAESVAQFIYDQNGVPIVPKTDGRIELRNEVWN